MAYDYHQDALDAEEMIAEFGTACKLADETGASKGTVTAVFLAIEKRAAPEQQTAGLPVNQSKVAYIAGTIKQALGVGMTLTTQKQAFRITEVETLQPATVAVLYRATVVS